MEFTFEDNRNHIVVDFQGKKHSLPLIPGPAGEWNPSTMTLRMIPSPIWEVLKAQCDAENRRYNVKGGDLGEYTTPNGEEVYTEFVTIEFPYHRGNGLG